LSSLRTDRKLRRPGQRGERLRIIQTFSNLSMLLQDVGDWLDLAITARWSAPAKRSGDGAFAHLMQSPKYQSGVALRLPPHSTSPDNKPFGGSKGVGS